MSLYNETRFCLTLGLPTDPSFGTKNKRSTTILTHKALSQANLFASIPFKNWIDMNSNEMELRERMQELLSLTGKCALVSFQYNKQRITEVLMITDYTEVNGELESLSGVGSSILYEGANSVRTTFQWDKKKGQGETGFKLSKDTLFYTEKLKLIPDKGTKEEFDVVFDYIPAVVFKNNATQEADFARFGVEAELIEIDKMSDEETSEFRRSRTLPYVNEAFAGEDTTAETLAHEIDSGEKKGITEEGIMAKAGAGTTMIPASQGILILGKHITELEDKIYKALACFRDTTADGKNRHGLEIITKDRFAIETAIRNQSNFQYYWNKFALMVKKQGITFEPKLQFPIIFEQSIEYLRASIQAEMAKSQGNTPQNKAGDE